MRSSQVPQDKTSSVTGLITLRQEDRFRLEDDQGVGYLFTLKQNFRISTNDIEGWSRTATRVAVRYRGTPDMGAVALEVRPISG